MNTVYENLRAAGEWQDKETRFGVSTASSEAPNEDYPPSKKSQTRRGQTVHPYLLNSELAIIKRLKGKKTQKEEIEECIRIGLSVKLGKQQVDVILPPILSAIDRRMNEHNNKTRKLLAETYYVVKQDEGETRKILEAIYANKPDLVHEIVRQERNKARSSL